MGSTALFYAFMRYVIKYIFIGAVAFCGILLGGFLRKKKNQKSTESKEDI